MRPSKANFAVSEVQRDAELIQQEIGNAIRLSFEAMADEPLSREIALLLVRLALTEALRNEVEEEDEEGLVISGCLRELISSIVRPVGEPPKTEPA